MVPRNLFFDRNKLFTRQAGLLAIGSTQALPFPVN